MSTENKSLKFIHLASDVAAKDRSFEAGAIIFEPKSGRIAVKGENALEYYGGGRIADAKFENSILTLSFNDGSKAITLDFSDTASASGVDKILGKLRYDVDALNVTINGAAGGDGSDGLVKKVEANETAIRANTSAIAAIKDESTGILAEAKKYADGLAKNYDAAGAAAQALVDAKAYTDGKIGDINGTVKDYVDAAKAAANKYTDDEVKKINTAAGDLGGRVTTLEGKVGDLETTVGNASSGLVKDVAANASAISDLKGLHADNGAGGKKNVATEVSEGVNAKVGDIKINGAAVTVKEYVDAGDAKALEDAKTYTNTKVGEINTAAEALEGRVDTLESTVGEHGTKITTLIGDDADKSVRAISAEEVAKVVANAPESYDTLKEIADWISNDTTGAASMANDISKLKITVGDASNGLVKKVNDNATAISGNSNAIDALEALHAKDGQTMKSVATEVSEGIAGIAEHSETNDKESPKTADVVVTVKTKSGSVSGVAVDASVLAGKVSANATAIATEKSRAEGVEDGLRTDVNAVRSDLGQTTDASTVTTTAFGRIKALEEAQSSGALTWFDWQ